MSSSKWDLDNLVYQLESPEDLQGPDEYDWMMDLLDRYVATVPTFLGQIGMGRPTDFEHYKYRANKLLNSVAWGKLTIRKLILLLMATHIYGYPEPEVQKVAVARVKELDPGRVYPLLHGLIEKEYLATGPGGCTCFQCPDDDLPDCHTRCEHCCPYREND